MDKILIVDDNPAVIEALSLLLELHGFMTVSATTPFEAQQAVQYQQISLVIQDMNFSADLASGEEGRALFYSLRELNPHLPVILITAWTELEMAIELVKAGAADYIAKPWDDQKLLTTVGNLVALGKANKENARLSRQPPALPNAAQAAQHVGLIYASHTMQRVIEMSLQVAHSDVPVLITGPNGSGKEKIAALIQAYSPLAEQAFVTVNAGALPPNLIEAELFGAEAGAYTGAAKKRIGRFEAADDGTLFLDEIGNLPADGQAKLLRVLQTGEFERLGSVTTQKVNVRVISATNANLPEQIRLGQFREDLYYRLNVIEIQVPPLVERKDDILPLIYHFLPGRTLTQAAKVALESYSWPGNVRELENACKRVAVLKPAGDIEPQDFAITERSDVDTRKPAQELDKAELEQAMARHQGVIARVAKELGLTRQALYRRLQKFGIEY